MSLARAFFQAGAHTVVASLWRLRDDEAADLFERFYRHLGKARASPPPCSRATRSHRGGSPGRCLGRRRRAGGRRLVPLPGGGGWNVPLWIWGLAAVILLLGVGALRRQTTA